MKITRDEVRRVARLAHLRFDDSEIDLLRDQLDQILRYVDKLRELDTEGVEPAVGMQALPGAHEQTLREDLPGTTLSTDEALAGAPDSGAGHFKVPKVLA